MNHNQVSWIELLACPTCHSPLTQQDHQYCCMTCTSWYPVVDGVIKFSAPNEFYEGKYPIAPVGYVPNESSIVGLAWLNLYSQHYLQYIRQHVPKGGRVLDVAGGSGTVYLSQHWRVAGLEVSAPHARAMAQHYELAICADALHIPLQDGCLDAVVSRFFLEHMPPEEKIRLIEEFRRVLKPGGWVVSLQDCECNNPLWRWAKHDVDLFLARFIENDGHYGLMYPSENLDMFQQAGFEVIRYQGTNKTPFVTLSMIEWMQPYREKSLWANILLGMGHAINQNRWLTHTYNIAMTLWDDIVGRWLPLNHARYLLAVCRSSK